jgi:hypothetical protein
MRQFESLPKPKAENEELCDKCAAADMLWSPSGGTEATWNDGTI